MAAADYRLLTDATGQRIAVALEAFQAVPYVATIPTGQWSGSGNDRYITVQASNVTANSLLVPHYDSASEALLNGPIWCVPAAGSFTIHTSAIPAGTVTVMVQLLGTLGEAQYQVLADVYSTSQVDSIVAQSTARMNNYNFGSKTVAQFKSELITYAATLGYRDYRHISVEISAAADGFVASTYVGTLQKTSSATRFIVTLNNAYEPAPADMILIYKDGTWTQGGIAQSTANRPYSVMVYFGTATSCVIEYTLPTSYNNTNQILFYGRNGYSNEYGVIGVIEFSITDESSISVYKNGTGTVSASRSGNKITVTADAYSSLTFVSGYIPIKGA